MLWICATDGVAFSVGAPACPQCGGTTYRDQDDKQGPARSTLTGEPVELADDGEPTAGRRRTKTGD